MKSLIIVLLCITVSLPVTADTRNELPDSLLTIDNIYHYTFSDYDKAVQIATTMRRRKEHNTFELDIAEGDLYLNNGKYHQALKYYRLAMESDSVKASDERTMNLMHRMISAYERLHNESKKTEYVEMLLQKARQAGDPVMESIALFNMGKTLYYQKDKERGYLLIHEAIKQMENSDYVYKKDNLIYNYNTLYIMQQIDKEYEEALKTLDKLAAVIEETTDEEFNMEGIYHKELKNMYAHRAYILFKLGRKNEAEQVYRKWKALRDITTKEDYLINSYLMSIGEYDEVLRIANENQDFLRQRNDTINYQMRTLKRIAGRAYEAKGDYKEATRYFEELAIITDSLKTREQKSSALELATVYETMEKEAEIQQKTAGLRLRNSLLIYSIVIIFLLIVMLWRNILHARAIRRKNQSMAKTINQLIEYKEEERKRKELSENEIKEQQPAALRTNKELFEQLDRIIVRDQLYLNRNLTREDIMLIIGVEKNRFGQIMKQEANTTITGYINNLRLEYAIKLLRENPEIPVNKIGEKVAIPNISTFYRLFKEKYGMTPIEFRKGIGTNSR